MELQEFLNHQRTLVERNIGPPLIGQFYHSKEWHPLRGKSYVDKLFDMACTVVPIRVPAGTEKVEITIFGTPIRVNPCAGELRMPHQNMRN